ncbi:transposase IS66 family protein [Candidatus Erwinia dacicola]|uniref:Transposase IS66 family protein n=1 Tax=Candidatus Erwinia dacicola TaxID=252393 RepID=A0A328TNS4_9GAMM|nr:transposase IS66 family protein [Candidatus Erwinia dacicola]
MPGFLPEPRIQTGIGDVSGKVPKLRERSGNGIHFNSTLLPPYLKRATSVEELLPWLYLRSISTGDFHVERSYAGPCLLARIVTAKFVEHTPHYRQSEIYRRQGVELSCATLGRWSGAVSELLEPLYNLLRQYVLMPSKVHTDDIPVPMQEQGSGKPRTARLWVYVRVAGDGFVVLPRYKALAMGLS